MRYVIVSGYADFEYARTALQLGADGYLLKPVNKDEMTSLLINVREKMVQERQQQSSGRSDPHRRSGLYIRCYQAALIWIKVWFRTWL